MKRIEFPQPKTVAEREWTARALLEEVVLSRSQWRASLETARAARALFDKLEKSNGHIDVTEREHEILQQEVRMDGMQLAPVALNRLFLELVEAVHDARKPPEGEA